MRKGVFIASVYFLYLSINDGGSRKWGEVVVAISNLCSSPTESFALLYHCFISREQEASITNIDHCPIKILKYQLSHSYKGANLSQYKCDYPSLVHLSGILVLNTRIGKCGTALLILVLDTRCWYCIYIVLGSPPS